MIHIIKNYKWVIATSLFCIIFGLLTFFTFINRSFIKLNDYNFQVLLIIDLVLLITFFTIIIYQTYKILSTWLAPSLIVSGGIVLGMIFKQVVHTRLKKAALKSEWEGDDVILNAVESQITLWFFWAALSLALRNVEIMEPYGLYVSKFLIIILITSITHAAAKLIVGLLDLWSKKQGGGFPSTTMFTNFVWVTVYIIGLLVILDAFDI